MVTSRARRTSWTVGGASRRNRASNLRSTPDVLIAPSSAKNTQLAGINGGSPTSFAASGSVGFSGGIGGPDQHLGAKAETLMELANHRQGARPLAVEHLRGPRPRADVALQVRAPGPRACGPAARSRSGSRRRHWGARSRVASLRRLPPGSSAHRSGRRAPYHGTPSAAVRNFCSGAAARQARVKRLRKSAAQASRSVKQLTVMKSLRLRSSIRGWSGS